MMKIYEGELDDVTRYLERHDDIPLEDKENSFEHILNKIRPFKTIDEKTEMLEVGVGTGWIPILCKKKGLRCKGIEISPQLVEYAYEYGRKYGIEPDIELGNIEDTDIGESIFDVIIATSVFEHVEHWREGLYKIYRALKPGGAFFFYSTNKFSPRSGEYNFPLYGWLPDSWRYRLRVARQGEDIMKLGIDFNQFTFPQLRRAFRKLGYSEIYDRLDLFCLGAAVSTDSSRGKMLRIANRIPPLKHLVLLFASGTQFVCIK
jgi:2-polyprenyl-3-methyl-5-hydroxy-6-metoxy-1,4-benzoquinol methylase